MGELQDSCNIKQIQKMAGDEMLMNPHTGSAQSRQDWRADCESDLDWLNFESAYLINVIWQHGQWIEI